MTAKPCYSLAEAVDISPLRMAKKYYEGLGINKRVLYFAIGATKTALIFHGRTWRRLQFFSPVRWADANRGLGGLGWLPVYPG